MCALTVCGNAALPTPRMQISGQHVYVNACGQLARPSANAPVCNSWACALWHTGVIWRLAAVPCINGSLSSPWCCRCPILLDAVASEMQRKGDSMMTKWAEIMTNMQPKTYFLRPHVAIPLGIAVVREFIDQKIFGKKDKYQMLPKA